MNLDSEESDRGGSADPASFESVTMWIDHLRQGSETHADRLWNHFVHRLAALARTKLGNDPRRVADEEDVVVRAMNSFFRGMQDQRFPDVHDRGDLWQVLAMLVDRKAKDQLRYNWAQRRGEGQVRGHSAMQGQSWQNAAQGFSGIEGPEPSPAFVSQSIDEIDRLFRMLDNEEFQTIALLRFEGLTHREIADRLKCSERTVERRLDYIRDAWKEALTPDESE